MGTGYVPVAFTRPLLIIWPCPLAATCIHHVRMYPHLCKVAPGSLFEFVEGIFFDNQFLFLKVPQSHSIVTIVTTFNLPQEIVA